MRADHPLLILGLDGLSFNLLEPLFARGELPHLAQLATSGWRTELWSTLPPATLPAWTSFLTAATPAEHGVTDLMMRLEDGYGLRPASARDRELPTFLSRLSALGLRVAAVGVPGTYPPEPINGVCLPGFDAPGTARLRRDAVWPPSLFPRLKTLGGWQFASFNEHAPAAVRLRRAADALITDLGAKERVILSLYQDEPWDLFFVHIMASDTAQHHLWHTHDLGSPRTRHPELKDSLTRVLKRIDALVGKLVALTPVAGRILVVSDHGMGGASNVAIHLNQWLADNGLLVFARGIAAHVESGAGRLLRKALAVLPRALVGVAAQRLPKHLAARLFTASYRAPLDLDSTLAFSDELDYAPSIWIHRRDRFQRGMVNESEARSLIARLRHGLMQLAHPTTGEPLVSRVYGREDLPPGPFAARAPDLLIEPAWPGNYRASFLPSRSPGPAIRLLQAEELDAGRGAGMPGVHRRQGLFMAVGEGITPLDIPLVELHQAGALIYPLLGVPAPADLAKSLPAFAEELWPISRAPGVTPAAKPLPASQRDDAEMLRQLDELGYLG